MNYLHYIYVPAPSYSISCQKQQKRDKNCFKDVENDDEEEVKVENSPGKCCMLQNNNNIDCEITQWFFISFNNTY